MKRWIILALLIIGAAVVIGFISNPDTIEVTVTSPERGLVENTVANTRAGTVKACQRSRLSLPIGGQIAQLAVKEGDNVSAGQLLMALWNDDRKARVAQTKALLLTAENEHESACITAKSDLRQANRLTRLAKEKLTSRESADLASARAEASAANCKAADSRITQARSELALAEALLAQTFLHAPFAGIVAEVTGEIGEYATPSPPGVATPPAIDLLTMDCHYISAPIDEVDAATISPGMPARVTLDAFRNRTFDATVRRISPYVLELEKQARTVEIEAELAPLPEHTTLLAGYSADIEIVLEAHKQTLRIPTELLIDDDYVYLVTSDNLLEKRRVTRGLANWRFTEITEGLTENDRLVVDIGSKGLEPGVKVSIAAPETSDTKNARE